LALSNICLPLALGASTKDDPSNWESIPPSYEFIGALLGSALAIALVFIWTRSKTINSAS
jgi:hypothetical protein